ncbi:MAG: dihydrodipicolinate synthase family protein, partial [Luteimonas sp.]
MRLSGSITALATPFTVAGEIDLDAWRRLLQQQLDAGTGALVVAGSTGEASALFASEYDLLLRTAVEVVAGKVPVVAGTGQPSTARTIEQTRRAGDLGADAALVVTPPYVRPTQAGLAAHYRAVADDGALPLVLYNVPPRTGCDMLPDTVAALAEHAQVIAVKEARSEPERMQALVALRTDDFG